MAMGYSCPYCEFYIDDAVPGIEIENDSYAEITCSYCHAELQIYVSIDVSKDGDKDKKGAGVGSCRGE